MDNETCLNQVLSLNALMTKRRLFAHRRCSTVRLVSQRVMLSLMLYIHIFSHFSLCLVIQLEKRKSRNGKLERRRIFPCITERKKEQAKYKKTHEFRCDSIREAAHSRMLDSNEFTLQSQISVVHTLLVSSCFTVQFVSLSLSLDKSPVYCILISFLIGSRFFVAFSHFESRYISRGAGNLVEATHTQSASHAESRVKEITSTSEYHHEMPGPSFPSIP